MCSHDNRSESADKLAKAFNASLFLLVQQLNQQLILLWMPMASQEIVSNYKTYKNSWLHAYGILPPIQQERGPERFQGETSKRGLSTKKGVENPYQELKQLLEGKPSSKKKGHAQHERSPSREREESESSNESMEDVAPRQRRAQRSPTPTKRKRSPHSPHRRDSKREEKNSKKKKERKRSPSSPSSSPSSSSDEGSGYSSQEIQRTGHRRSYAAWKRSSKLKNFKEGGKNISFLTYDGTFGATDKVLAFIQQFDAGFGDEGFMESSQLRHVAMHFQKSARQWWSSLRANGEAPKTWKALRASIMKQFLASDAKDKVLTKWRSLKLSPYESIHKYVDKFWDLHLKATVYKRIDFEEQKQQFCAGLPEDMNEYVNSQSPRSISVVIHHTMVVARINFQQGAKRNLKPMEAKEKQEYKGKKFFQNSSKGNSNNNKAKEKGVFKGKNKLTPEEFERYRKENKCFKCGEQGHSYRSCLQRNPRNEQLRASMVEAPKEELATKLGVQDFEMGDAMKADGAFINQEVSVTPLIGKLRLHIQGYVDKEDFFLSPLKHEDVILGAPWFDCLAASIKFPERKISFKFREKDMYINAQESGSSIPLVNNQAFDKSIKSSIFAYMIFVKDSLNGVDVAQLNENGMKVDLELFNFLNQFRDVFIDDIPGALPPKRGDDDHMIALIPGISPLNKPSYRVSQAQQEEIMRQVNELVEKGMTLHREVLTNCGSTPHDLTKKNVKYVWTEKRQQAFDTLKQKLISQPVLALPDLSKPFEVQCDACGDCLGAVLLQEGHAIAYESRRISSDEQIFGIYEKELLAVLHALDSWKHYLLGTPFILRTDHQSLKYFMMQTKLFDKQMRWANFLSRFNFHIAHIAGKHNQVADALSRRPKVNAVSIATHNDLSSMIDEYAIDSDYKDLISAIALGKKEEPFTLHDGYLLHGNMLCITRSLGEKVMFESHAPPYAGHRGIQTTMKAIETYFYWPTMKGDIQDYVSKCVVCQKTKYDRGKQPGLLQPLPIPDSLWESISMDFIFGLLKSIHGNTGIWTIVDRFSKQAHFIPVKKIIKAHQMATLFISQVSKYHRLPTSIVSDRDPRMTNNFWKGLFENLGTRLNFSSAYHPQTDGQCEIANLTILDLLKAYVTEVDQCSQWEKYLPLVEYAYNNTIHTSTGKAPFEVIEGRPKSPLLLKQKQKAAANKHRRALAFKENDWVLLKFPKARLRHTTGKNPMGHQKYYAKLAKRYYGSFQILKPINEMAYQLKLPKHGLIHNAFHVSLLKPYKGEPPKEAILEDPPEVEGQEEVLQPESVLRHENKVLRNGKIIQRCLIKFKNYPFEDAKWMQGTQLKDSLHLVNAYNDSLEATQPYSLLTSLRSGPLEGDLLWGDSDAMFNYVIPSAREGMVFGPPTTSVDFAVLCLKVMVLLVSGSVFSSASADRFRLGWKMLFLRIVMGSMGPAAGLWVDWRLASRLL
ncbi:hypothetical protein L7F22_001469 [Adiantum nelumboides]|nr:hypothetical protein [Adiantum nelumboides]